MKQPVTYLGKHVGTIDYLKRTFTTPRRPEHYFIKFRGFGISFGLLRYLTERGVIMVIFIYTKKNGQQQPFMAPLTAFYSHGHQWTDREADTQRILALQHMKEL